MGVAVFGWSSFCGGSFDGGAVWRDNSDVLIRVRVEDGGDVSLFGIRCAIVVTITAIWSTVFCGVRDTIVVYVRVLVDC